MRISKVKKVKNYNDLISEDWFLVHDGTNVITTGKGGQVSSKHTIIDFKTELEMEQKITNLKLKILVLEKDIGSIELG